MVWWLRIASGHIRSLTGFKVTSTSCWPHRPRPQHVSPLCRDFAADLKYWIIRPKLSKNPLHSHLCRLSLMDPDKLIIPLKTPFYFPSGGLEHRPNVQNSAIKNFPGFPGRGLIKMRSQRTLRPGRVKLTQNKSSISDEES